MIIFKYNGKIYKAQHLKNKLKKLGCTEQDIEIIPEEEKPIEYEDKKLYYFINPKTKETIVSIYPTLDHLGKYGEGFEQMNKCDIALEQVRECKKAHPEWFSTKEIDKQIFESILK